MRILIGSNTPRDMRLGVARVMHFIGEGWSQIGHHVDYLYAQDVPTTIRGGRLPWINYALGALAVVRTRERQGERYDLLNFHGGDGCFVGLYDRLRGHPARLVVTLHGVEEMHWGVQQELSRCGHAPGISAKEYVARYGLRRSQTHLAVRCARCVTLLASQAGRDFVLKHYPVDATRLLMVSNGVSPEYMVQHHYPPRATKLLFVGTWFWAKGIRCLAEAFERSACRHEDLELSLVGTKELPPAVIAGFASGLDSRLHILPYIENDQVRQACQSHDLFILPSVSEGYPLAMLEAMAAGMPVIVSDAAGSAVDLIESGKDGFLFPSGDSKRLSDIINMLVDDVELRTCVGRNAQKKVQELTWDRVAAQWLTAIRGVDQGRE